MDSQKRTLAKTILWRISGILLFMFLTWITTGNITYGVELGIVYNIIRFGQYYVSERLWTHVKWGQKEKREL